MNNQGWPNRTMAQGETGNQKGQNGMNKRMALARRLMPVVVALAALVGLLGMAPAAQADNCAYSADGYTALCPGGSNAVYHMYQAYNGRWNYVATAWFRDGFTYLSASGLTVARNNSNGQTWLYNTTSYSWINITGMNSQTANNTLVQNQVIYDQARLIQIINGLTTMPSLWP